MVYGTVLNVVAW